MMKSVSWGNSGCAGNTGCSQNCRGKTKVNANIISYQYLVVLLYVLTEAYSTTAILQASGGPPTSRVTPTYQTNLEKAEVSGDSTVALNSFIFVLL